MFYPMAGARFRVGTNLYAWKTADFLEADFTVDTFTQVGEVEGFENIMIGSKAVEFDALFPAFKRRAKGARDFGTMALTYALDAADPGQKLFPAMEQAAGDYAFNVIFNDAPVAPITGTVTISVATPGVVTLAGHGLSNGSAVKLATGGTLPTGLTAGTTYYVIGATANTFSLSLTKGGAGVNTTGAGSGTHTLTSIPAPSQRFFIGKVMSLEDVPGDGPEAVLKGKLTIAINCKPVRVEATP